MPLATRLLELTTPPLAESSIAEVMIWLVLVMVLLVVGLMWATRLKRRMNQADEPVPATGFTLSDLRQMHRAGQLTDAEFAKAKDKIVEAARRAPEPPATAAGAGAAAPPAAPDDRFSADAIRARRAAREDPRRGFDVLPPGPGPDDASKP
jgi:hypothetical protein